MRVLVVLVVGVMLASLVQGSPVPPTDVRIVADVDIASEISVLDYGAKCDGVTDDSVALQAAITAADTAPFRTLRLPHGVCVFRTPLLVGGHKDRYCAVNIAGVSEYFSSLTYIGPMDRAAITISHCSAFRWQGFAVSSGASANYSTHGTSVGIQIDGPTPSGTLNTAITFDHILIAGFFKGMLVGKLASASEIVWQQCTFNWNDIGWTASNYNSLNFWFYGVHLSNNKIGLRLGGPWVTDAPHVIGGSSSQNTTADFFVGNTFGTFSIQDFRAEVTAPGAKFLTGTSGAPFTSLRGNTVLGTAGTVVIDLLNTSELIGNSITGQVTAKFGAVVMRQNTVREGSPGLPVVLPVSATDRGLTLDLSDNFDEGWNTTKRLRFPDYRGYFTNALAIGDPDAVSSGASRHRVTFSGSEALATFQRVVSVMTTAGSYTLTFADGAITAADMGQPISVRNATSNCGYAPGQPTIDAVDGRLRALTSATQATFTVNPFLYFGTRCRPPINQTGVRDAIIGENATDAAYTVTVGCNANEQVWVTDKTAQGFTLHSSNPTSTATCDVMVMR